MRNQLNEANQSNAIINIRDHRTIIFEQQESASNKYQQDFNPHTTPIITENVPFTNQSHVSSVYIAFNIIYNILLATLIAVMIISTQGAIIAKYFLIVITVAFYFVYLIIGYNFSNLFFLTDLRSLHEYELVFKKLVKAECRLQFNYMPARNMIDEKQKIYKMQYENIKINDRSGQLYNIQKTYNVACIKYKKKFYFLDSTFKGKVNNDFNQYIQKCKKEHDKKDSKKLLRSRQKLQFTIEGLKNEIGYYIQEDNCYRCWFLSTYILGFGVYYQLYMKRKVLRYEMDIVKQLCPKPKQ